MAVGAQLSRPSVTSFFIAALFLSVIGFDGTLRGAVVTVLSDCYLFAMAPKLMKKKRKTDATDRPLAKFSICC
jgi:hypothetical protein